MTAVMAFALTYYYRSYRYIAPLLVYAISIIFIYNIVPNPVMPSYSLTSTLLFMISIWLGYGYIDVEDEVQQLITALHVRDVSKYYAAKVLVMILIVCALSLLTVLYPAMFGKLIRFPTLSEAVVALLSHFALCFLGIAIAFLFTSKVVKKKSSAIVGLFLFTAISLAGAGIISALPTSLEFIGWLLPPVFRLMKVLNDYESATKMEVIISLTAPLIYGLLLLAIFLKWMKRKLF
jgi:hypothetical protein